MEAYLGFVLVCMGVEVISIAACIKKFKREGYRINSKKKSFFENVCELVKFTLENFIPGYNVLLVASTLLSATNENFWNIFLEKCIEKGAITKTDEQLAKEEAESLAKMEEFETRKSLDTIGEDVVNKYSMMSNDEKIALLKRERDRVLMESEEEKGYQKIKHDKE